MKLIIEVDEETYNNCVEWQNENRIKRIIASGIPYEERPQGEWIDKCTLPIIRKCSLCGNEIGNEMGFYNNFCPNCGADMRGKEE